MAGRKTTRHQRIDWTGHLKLRVVWIGKTRDAGLARIANELAGRIGHFVPIGITELKDPKAGDDQRQLAAEGERLLAALDGSDRVVVLDPAGELWTSTQLSKFLASHLRSDPRRLTFVIGGYAGLADVVKKRADKVWSLSPLTFTHEMTRVLVIEQLYRALAILNNHPYSK